MYVKKRSSFLHEAENNKEVNHISYDISHKKVFNFAVKKCLQPPHPTESLKICLKSGLHVYLEQKITKKSRRKISPKSRQPYFKTKVSFRFPPPPTHNKCSAHKTGQF